MPILIEWCTPAWAAEHLNVSLRTVGRYVAAGRLEVITPLCGSRESKRGHRMLHAEKVRELRSAREVVGRG